MDRLFQESESHNNVSKLHQGMSDRFSGLGSLTIKIFLPLLIILSTVTLFVMPINGYDHVSHLLWIKTFTDLIRAGVLIPRWLPNSFAGLGAPSFYFYPPLAYYLSAVVSIVGTSLSPTAIYHIVGAFATWGSFATFYYMLREFKVTSTRALVPSLIFAFAPYRFFDLYVRNGYGEHLGYMFVPLFFLGLIEILHSSKRLRDFVLLTLSWTAIILSNIPLFLVMAIASVITLLIFRPKPLFNAWLRAALAIFIGSGMAAYYLLPILHFKPYAQLDYVLSRDGPSDPTYYVRCLIAGVNTTLGLIGIGDTLVAIGVVVLFILARKRSREQPVSEESSFRMNLLRNAAWFCIFAQFLAIPYLTLPIWQNLLIMQLVQFTYRFDFLIVFWACVAAAFWDGDRRERILKWTLALWCVAGVGLAGINDLGLKLHLAVVSYTIYDPAEYAPACATRDVAGVIQFATQHAHDDYATPSPALTAGEHLSAMRKPEGGGVLQCKFVAPHTIVLHTFYWPNWKFTIAGREIPSAPIRDGRLSVVLPAGEYTADLSLVRLPIEKQSGNASLAFIGLFFIACIALKRNESTSTGRTREQ
jgi:hypothetical protein